MTQFRQVLLMALVMGLVLSPIAFPAQAEEEAIPMWVQRARLAYTGRAPKGPDAVGAWIHVRDANLEMVVDAAVTAEWTLPDGTVLTTTQLSGFQGIAKFSLWAGRGEYKICVLNITKSGWLYTPSLDRETCPVFIVP